MTTKDNSMDEIKALMMLINCNTSITNIILLDAHKEKISNKNGVMIKQMIEEVGDSVNKLLNIK